ncbi:MAG: adenylyltransferase/cytidyltransferase family protein [Verrucomicrobiota bacterium]
MTRAIISSAFDSLNSQDLRFLDEASKHGELHVLLWSDEAIAAITGKAPKFPLAERLYYIQATRYVKQVHVSGPKITADALPDLGINAGLWVVDEREAAAAKQNFCEANQLGYQVITAADLAGFPTPQPQAPTGRKKVVVTGCYDWFHTGHIAFFEEVSQLGDLYVVVGHDENIRLLKGEGHPLFKEDERRYVTGSIRYVTQALVSSGTGWMDAEPEIVNFIKADMYAVNEDGDKPEKREFCAKHGLEYVVLKRVPKEGLTRRSSTDLRGF